MALEAADGTTIFMRSDRLQEELARLYPEAVKDGQIDLPRFRDREAASRKLGDWVWQKVSALRLDRDAMIDLALDQAKKRALDWLGEKLPSEIKDLDLYASTLGAQRSCGPSSRSSPANRGYQWRGRAPREAEEDQNPTGSWSVVFSEEGHVVGNSPIAPPAFATPEFARRHRENSGGGGEIGISCQANAGVERCILRRGRRRIRRAPHRGRGVFLALVRHSFGPA